MTNLLLATSNGTGMGHLTRQAAVGLALGAGDTATLFSLSIGLPLAMSLGLRGEYCPSYDRPWIASNAWNSYLRDRLLAIIEETASDVILFDGVAAYPGIGKASSSRRDVAFIWLRRGMWRSGTGSKQLKRSVFFDEVIEPGDLAGDADRGPTAGLEGVVRVPPISLVEVLAPHPRDEARKALGIPLDREVALVTLGSGRLGDVTGPGQVVIDELLEKSDLHIAVTRSAVAENEVPVEQADRVTVIRDVYPLVPYLGAFDLAVSSAGYNAVHELVPAGLPTLLVANTSTRTDDQHTRARRLAELGLALGARDDEPAAVALEMRRLLGRPLRSDLAAAAASTRTGITGAAETGRHLSRFAGSFEGRRPSLAVFAAEQLQRGKDAVKTMLGEQRTNALKKALGRRPTEINDRTEVRLTDAPAKGTDGPLPLLMTEDLSRVSLTGPGPVEHILAGAGPVYLARRRELIDLYYDVVP